MPLYSPIGGSASAPSSPSFDSADSLSDDLLLKPAQRHAARTPWSSRPSLSRFLADFTLGFADGLTVPFALTAGLSSLGQTETVIYAGMAEICAGSISMGIGGYLSAKGEASAPPSSAGDEEEEEVEDEKRPQVAVDQYLAPLDLPPELLELVQKHISARVDVAGTLVRRLAPEQREEDDNAPAPPIMSGLSVAIGYLIGGSLPLFPYCVVDHVGDGLLWSFVVCVIALFAFGFTKDSMLHLQKQREIWINEKGIRLQRWGWTWKDVRRSSWEGAQMVMLGSIAALAAVLCVRLFEGIGHNNSPP